MGDSRGYIPGWGNGTEPQFTSHETACLPNTSDEEAHVTITACFSDREPVGPYKVTVPARRTLHVRFHELEDPEPIPTDTGYASVIESDGNKVGTHEEHSLWQLMIYHYGRNSAVPSGGESEAFSPLLSLRYARAACRFPPYGAASERRPSSTLA